MHTSRDSRETAVSAGGADAQGSRDTARQRGSAAGGARRTSRLRLNRRAVIGGAGVLVALVAWQLVVDNGLINSLFLSSPTDIARELGRMFGSGEIWPHLQVSAVEFVLGFALAATVGIVIGFLYGWYTFANDLLSPFINIFYATPRIALVPVFIIIFGIGVESKVAIIFVGCVIEIILNTAVGVRTVDPKMRQLAKSYGASDLTIFRTVALPHSVPYIVTGLRMGVGHGLVGVVVGELFASEAGVGHVLVNAAARFQMDRMYAALIIFCVAGVVLTELLSRVEAHYALWRDDAKK